MAWGGGIATRRKPCQPFLTRNSFNPEEVAFRGNRKPDRERERGGVSRSSCDSRHVEEIYSRGRGGGSRMQTGVLISARVSWGQFHRFEKCSTFASTSVFSKTCQWAVSNYVRYWRGWKFHSKCLQGIGWSLDRKEALKVFLPRVFVESLIIGWIFGW